MNSEEKFLGYPKKKTLAVIVAIIIAGVSFFAGAKYEKGKLSSMGLLKSGTDSSVTATSGATKTTKKPKPNTNTPSQNSANSPASINTQGNVSVSATSPQGGNATSVGN